MAPLIRPITVQLPRADLDPRAEMSLNVRQNRLLMGLLAEILLEWLLEMLNQTLGCRALLFKVRLIAVIS